MVLPNLFLVDKDSKVLSRTVQVSNLEDEVKKVLKLTGLSWPDSSGRKRPRPDEAGRYERLKGDTRLRLHVPLR